MEPDERCGQKSDEKIVAGLKGGGEPQPAENEKTGRGDEDFRIDVETVEENRGRQGDEEPEAEGQFFPAPGFPGIEVKLNSEKDAEEAHGEADQEDQGPFA